MAARNADSESWPERLRTVANLCFSSPVPTLILWAPDFLQIYNDRFAPLLGDQHPRAFGRPRRETAPHLWEEETKIFEAVLERGEVVHQEHQRYPMPHAEGLYDAYFKMSYSPIPGSNGHHEGIFVQCWETTADFLATRRARILSDLAEAVDGTPKPEEVFRRAADVLSKASDDLISAQFTVADNGNKVHRLAGSSGAAERGSVPVNITVPAGKFEAVVSRQFAVDPAHRIFLETIAAIAGGAAQRALRAQQDLALKEKELARLTEELQQFAYVTSHDLQEPLRMISSYSQMLARRFQGSPDPDVAEFVSYISDGVERTTALIRDLVAYSRVLSPTETEVSRVELDGPLQWALMNLQKPIAESQAVATFDDLPAVQGNALQLVQLFQHLIGNAIKYRSDKPPQIHVSAVQHGDEWIISMSDNGIGIEPQYFERIFGVFKRLHGKAYPGTGMGLALCRKIVEQHHGRIWVESEPGRGSTFRFTLPAA
jgi:signal transduction histidine kinase